MGESDETRLKRLSLRSMRRGIKEMDLILSAFAEGPLARLPPEEIALYDRLLAENDHDILAWVTGAAPVPAPFAGLIGKVRMAAAGIARL